MFYKRERDMYPDVVAWLKRFLRAKFPRANVIVADTSRVALCDFIAKQGIHTHFKPEWITYDIHVDVTGIVISKGLAQLAFVECKLGSLTLSDVSQLLGYSRIALPLFSFLISPKDFSDAVVSLIRTYSRTDALEYQWEKGKPAKTLVLASWNSRARQIEPSTILPNSASSIFGRQVS